MLVICLEGSHGAGKTELCKCFETSGFTVLDEAFMDMPAYALHPQSLLMETTWVCSWFERLLEKSSKLTSEERTRAVFVADRSPFSAVFYSRRQGHLLEPLIREHIAEVRDEAAIHIVTAHLRVEPELLWGRIQARLRREPFRARYREGEREWMDTAQGFYNAFGWDITLHNGDQPVEELLEKCLSEVAKVSGAARRLVEAASPPHLKAALLGTAAAAHGTTQGRLSRGGSVSTVGAASASSCRSAPASSSSSSSSSSTSGGSDEEDGDVWDNVGLDLPFELCEVPQQATLTSTPARRASDAPVTPSAQTVQREASYTPSASPGTLSLASMSPPMVLQL